jgi:hypothetical protein
VRKKHYIRDSRWSELIRGGINLQWGQEKTQEKDKIIIIIIIVCSMRKRRA